MDIIFIQALYEKFKSPYLFDTRSYLPMHIIIEAHKVHGYREICILRELLVNKLPLHFVVRKWGALEQELLCAINDTLNSIETMYHDYFYLLPKEEYGVVKDEDILVLCQLAGVPVYYVGNLTLFDIGLPYQIVNKLNSAGIMNVAKLVELMQDPNWYDNVSGIGKSYDILIRQTINERINTMKFEDKQVFKSIF